MVHELLFETIWTVYGQHNQRVAGFPLVEMQRIDRVPSTSSAKRFTPMNNCHGEFGLAPNVTIFL